MLDLLRINSARALHQRDIVVQGLLEPLRPVQPVVATFQFRLEQGRIVPGVRREAWQAETITTKSGPADDRGDPVLETMILQCVNEVAREVAILFRKCKRVGERFNWGAQFLLNRFF